jgi:radical SAM superfamily enzyme with C-terminal helix-hairpin-helix motif
VKILLLDGYIDEPGCLGVPPYLAPLPRYIFGALYKQNFRPPHHTIEYYTIDQFRQKFPRRSHKESKGDQVKTNREKIERLRSEFIELQMQDYEILIVISGVSVPGNYLGGKPIRFTELKWIAERFPLATKILCGPATKFGIGEEGGKPSIPVERLGDSYGLIIKGDAEIALLSLMKDGTLNHYPPQEMEQILNCARDSMDLIHSMAVQGAEIVLQHPNFATNDTAAGLGGNLVCEIETFRGCPRYHSGGCAFCVEPLKGATLHREIDSIVAEIKALYEVGVRHFRLGAQTDFYAFQHGEYLNPRYPIPNPNAIEKLLKLIRAACPDIKTLHIDNVNALNFAYYPSEAEQITQIIAEHCTPGNIAAIGVESVDEKVIKANNLKANEDQVFEAIKVINKHGKEIGQNGLPKFLPGLNFIMGLPGEIHETLNKDLAFLLRLLENDLWVRRINLRKYLVSQPSSREREQISPDLQRSAKKKTQISQVHRTLAKNEKFYFTFKEQVREQVDFPMLQRIFPLGRHLIGVYAEIHEGNGTFLRQPGTYPILCFVPRELPLNQYYNLVVIDHGYRSITCLVDPVNFGTLSLKEFEAIQGIGKKRAISLSQKRPKTKSEFLEILPIEVIDQLQRIGKINP